MKIAIIDGINQDIGLKILFPEADYYIYDKDNSKNNSINKYNIKLETDWNKITDKNYDYLFIIVSLYDTFKSRKFYQPHIDNILNKGIDIINHNNFKKVFVFDNYDYDYDPNTIINNKKINLFFKRNYNKKKHYLENVIPFPFIMFGDKSIIEKIDNSDYSECIKHDRVFFTGTIFTHIDNQIEYVRDRKIIFNKVKGIVYNPGRCNYDKFLKLIKESKFSLDLNGVGDPNKRTFEILSSDSLRLSEYNDLKWPFPENFSEETIFSNADELIMKLNLLRNNKELYKKCLLNQLNISKKYLNKKWIKEYICKFIKNEL